MISAKEKELPVSSGGKKWKAFLGEKAITERCFFFARIFYAGKTFTGFGSNGK